MQSRKAGGATLALVAAAAVIIIIIGVGIFFLMQVFGGFRELQHATDAGNLNVAKQALKTPSYVIANDYQLDFSGLVDGQNGMDLQTYDRVFGQAWMVGVNAMADRPQGNPGGPPSSQGLQDAQMVSQAANSGDPSNGSNIGVGSKLYQAFALKNNNALFNKFSYVATGNSARMLGEPNGNQIAQNTNAYDISFMEPAGPTNVWVDLGTLPYIGDSGAQMQSNQLPAGSLAQANGGNVNNKVGAPYLAGYVQLPMGAAGTTWQLVGVPMFPGRQAHHVAGRDFVEAQAANASKFQGVVPPNAFKSVTDANNKSSNTQAQMEAYAIAGTPNNQFPDPATRPASYEEEDYQAGLPNGYISIVNPAGYGAQTFGPPTGADANELMNGVSLGTLSNGDIAFSTGGPDPKNPGNMLSGADFIQAWANYNSDPTSYPKPASVDNNGNALIYFADGSGNLVSASSTDSNSMIQSSMGTTCFWNDVQGPSASAPCSNLNNAIHQAWPPDNFTPSPAPGQLMAVEELKLELIHQFNHCGNVTCPAPITLPDGTIQEGTGLRYWFNPRTGTQGNAVTHSGQEQPITPGAPVAISQPGTIDQLIQETCPSNENQILQQIAQRMQEIYHSPSLAASTEQAQYVSWLQNNPQTFQLNTVFYIWYSTTGGWQMTSNAPPGQHMVMNASGNPQQVTSDGSLQRYASDPVDPSTNTGGYQTIPTLVDPHHENGIHLEYFTAYPDPTTTSRGVDVIDWQPSSGYGNLLGTLTFRNFCAGTLAGSATAAGGMYCAPD